MHGGCWEDAGHHDVGFMINGTYGAGYRLTQNAAYRDVVIAAADSLATRYSDVVGATRSWDPASWQRGDWDYAVIIDNMMNLELFMHATTLSGDDSYRAMGINHAVTTLNNHFRNDFSSYHVVDYNPSTGAAVAKQTQQGLTDESAWARGQTWGLYGFSMMHRESGDARFRTQAQAIADFYTQSPLMPEDGVPLFDFQAVEEGAPEHRDSSAGAIAASALIELASFSTGEAKERYLDFGIKALRSLSSSAYRAAPGANSNFLLMHSVGSYPENSEVDVAMNYADYYYLEGLLRCSRL